MSAGPAGRDGGHAPAHPPDGCVVLARNCAVHRQASGTADQALAGLGLEQWTENDYQLFQTISTDPNPFKLIVNSVCPAIFGHEIVKAGMPLSSDPCFALAHVIPTLLRTCPISCHSCLCLSPCPRGHHPSFSCPNPHPGFWFQVWPSCSLEAASGISGTRPALVQTAICSSSGTQACAYPPPH